MWVRTSELAADKGMGRGCEHQEGKRGTCGLGHGRVKHGYPVASALLVIVLMRTFYGLEVSKQRRIDNPGRPKRFECAQPM